MRKYGSNFTVPEDRARCVVEVWNGWRNYQCGNKRGKGAGEWKGMLCGTHARMQARYGDNGDAMISASVPRDKSRGGE